MTSVISKISCTMLLHDTTQVTYKKMYTCIIIIIIMSDQNKAINECKTTLKVHGAIPVHDIKINFLTYKHFETADKINITFLIQGLSL